MATKKKCRTYKIEVAVTLEILATDEETAVDAANEALSNVEEYEPAYGLYYPDAQECDCAYTIGAITAGTKEYDVEEDE